MDNARWERIQALFHQAADRPPGEQQAFLEDACGDDLELRADVNAMLDETRAAAPSWIRTLRASRTVSSGRPNG